MGTPHKFTSKLFGISIIARLNLTFQDHFFILTGHREVAPSKVEEDTRPRICSNRN
jgi:hypothetical protein